MEKIGIENLKVVLKAAADFGEQTAAVLEDGKIKTTELFNYIDELMQIPGVIKAVPNLKAEFKDLDENEQAELVSYVELELDLPNDQVEGFIEDAFEWTLRLLAIVDRFKAIKAAKA